MADEKCPSCGTPYEADSTFCINCGAKRVVTPPPAQPAAPEPPKEAAPPPAAAPSPQPATAAPATPSSQPAPAPPAETTPSDDAVLDRLDKKLSETQTGKATPPPPQPAAPAAQPAAPAAQPAAPAAQPTPPPVQPAAPAAPVPTPTPPPAAAAPPPPRDKGPDLEPKPKKSKGCCIFGAIAGIVGVIVAGILIILYASGVFGDLGIGGERGGGYFADFATVNQEDFDVLLQGKNAEVKGHEGMLKARNALIVARYDAGVNYKATCLVTVTEVNKPEGWAGLCLRVNPKGAERYVFQVFPATQEIRISKIGGKGEPVVLKKGRVKTIAPGKVLTLGATAVGNDLTMELDGTPVFKTTDIGLMNGPVGLEARDVTAYFDDLTITSL